MYCSNCGNKITGDSKFCTECGKELKGKVVTKETTEARVIIPSKNYRGLDIASMVLGIIGCLYALSVLFSAGDLSISYYIDYYSTAYVAGYIFGTVLVQLIFATLSLVFSCVGRKTNKNGFNTAGLSLAIAIFALAFLTIIVVIA